MDERVTLAVQGALCGFTLGAPFVGRQHFTHLTFFDPVPARMAASPALDAWLVGCAHVAAGLPSSQLCSALSDRWRYMSGPSAFAAANAARGLLAPASGWFSNPLAHDAGAVGRGALWGLVFPEDPVRAARWAQVDASYDHTDEGVWAACAVAAGVSSARPGATLGDVLAAMSSVVPPDSTCQRTVSSALQKADPRVVQATSAAELKTSDPCDALLALAFVLAGLKAGRDAVTATLRAVGCGGPADQVGLASGVLATLLFGAFPEEWLAVIGESYVAGHGLTGIDPPATVDEFCQRVLQVVVAPPPPPPAAAPTEPTEEAAIPADSEEPQAEAVEPAVEETPAPRPAEPLPYVPPTFDTQVAEAGGLVASLRLLSGPVALDGKPVEAALTLTNTGAEPVEAQCSVEAPSGWVVATRLARVRVEAGSTHVTGLVVQAPKLEEDGHLVVRIGETPLSFAVLAPQRWWAAGPFDNPAADAYTKDVPAERDPSAGDHFSGRSGLSVRWAPLLTSGCVIDVEPLFQSGPGVVVLWSRMRLDPGRRYRLVAAGSPGVVVKVDGTPLVRYMDTHVPVPRDKAPYSASFESTGETTVVVKLIRDRQPAAPFTFYVMDEEGRVVVPASWSALPE